MVHLLRHDAQGQFPEGRKVGLLEKMVQRGGSLGSAVYLPFLKTRPQLLRRDVHQLDAVRLRQHGIRHGFLYGSGGNVMNGIGTAFQMLHVQRGVNVYPCGQQILHILVALPVTHSGNVRMRQLVHQNELGLHAQRLLQVELLHLHAPVSHFLHGKARQPADKAHRILPAMGFRHADHDLHALARRLDGGLQHGVRLAHSRRHAEEDFQQAAAGAGFLPPDGGQNPVCPLAVRMRF